MKVITLQIEDYLYDFYKKIGLQAEHRQAEQVMRDVLYEFAANISIEFVNGEQQETIEIVL